MTTPTTTLHLEKAIEKQLVAGLEEELRKLGITESGTEVPLDELLAEPEVEAVAGLGAWPPKIFSKAFPRWFGKAVKAKQIKIVKRPGKPPAAKVTKSQIVRQARPWIRETAAKMAGTVRKGVKKIGQISRPTAEKEMLPAGAIVRLRKDVVEDLKLAVPEAAVDGGMFGLNTFLTPGGLRRAPSVSGGNIGGRLGAEEAGEDVDYDLEEGAKSFGDDIERGAAVFGQDDIARGAAAFDDFITSLDVEDAGTVSGLAQNDIEAGARAFDGGGAFGQDDIEAGARAFDGGMGQDDIEAGARAFDQFLTADQIEDAGTVSGLGKMVSTAARPGATRTVFSDTFHPYAETDWAQMQYPRAGVYEEAVRPPTPANTARIAAKAVKRGIAVLEKTKSPAKAVVSVAKMGVVKPGRAGIGKSRTAGQAAYRSVMRGINRYANMRWGTRAIRARKAPLRGLSGLEGPSIDGNLF